MSRKYLNFLFYKIGLFLLGIYLSFFTPFIQVKISFIYKKFIDTLVMSGNWSSVKPLFIFLLTLYFLMYLLTFLSAYFLSIWGEYFTYNIKQFIFKHIQNLEYLYHIKHSASFFISRILSDPSLLQAHLFRIYFAFLKELPTALILFFGILFLNPRFALFSLMLAPLILFINLFVSPIIKEKTDDLQKNMTYLYSHLQESISGIATIKSLIGEEKNFKTFCEVLYKCTKSSLSLIKSSLLLSNLNSFISSSFFILLLFIIAPMLSFNNFTIGDLFALNILMSNFINSLNNIISIIPEIKAISIPIRRIKEILELPLENEGNLNLSLNLKEVEFKNVGFSFNENGKGFEMKDLNFTIKKGEKIAIIGPSGAGKSTLVKLMLNFLKPQNGEIFINGIPVQNIRKKELRKKILYFPQEYFLFSDTILKNVIFPEENRELSIVEEATKMTKIYQKISSLPEKFNTKLERNGSNFSGGERQRIVLSRLFVKKDWEILILDESFKEIDLSTENEVLQKILERYKDRTIIYITHRLNSIKNFDKIIFLKNGKIEGIGKHEDLMKNCEAYKKIFLKQGGKNDVELFDFYSGINK